MKILKNYLYNVSYQLLTILVPIITIPYITSTLTQTQIGINSFVQSNATYFVYLGILGMDSYGCRKIAMLRDDKNKMSSKFFELYSIQLIMHIFSIIIYSYIFLVLPNENKIVYALYLLFIFSSLFDVFWFYKGIEEFKTISIRNTIVKLVGMILLFLIVKSPDDFYKYILVIYLPQLLIQFYMWITLRKYINFKYFKFTLNIDDFKGALSYFLPFIASSIYLVLDKTILGILGTMDEVAIYDQSQKIVRIALTVISSISAVLMPQISNLFAKKDDEKINQYMLTSSKYIWIFAFGMLFGLNAISNNFVPWFYGKEYLSIINIFWISALLFVIVGGANLVATQYLIPIGKQRLYTIALIISSIVNLIFNVILIPHIGMYGAAIGSVIAEFVGVSLEMYFANCYFNIRILFQGFWKPILCGIVMFLVIYPLSFKLSASILNTVFLILFGATIYMGGIIILNYSDLKSILKNKFHS